MNQSATNLCDLASPPLCLLLADGNTSRYEFFAALSLARVGFYIGCRWTLSKLKPLKAVSRACVNKKVVTWVMLR